LRQRPSGEDARNVGKTSESSVKLVTSALLLDLGFIAASLVAIGVLALVSPESGPAWLAVLAIACGGSAACLAWRRGRRVLQEDESATARPDVTAHSVVVYRH